MCRGVDVVVVLGSALYITQFPHENQEGDENLVECWVHGWCPGPGPGSTLP